MAKSESKLPIVPFHLSLIGIVLALASFRFFISESSDRHKCNSLLENGRFLEGGIRAWQPEGCMLHQYKSSELESCLKGRHVVFAGDSIVRSLYYSTLKLLDPSSTENGERHSDKVVTSKGIKFSFYWDPYLNETSTDALLGGRMGEKGVVAGSPTLLVLGSGVWHLRNAVNLDSWRNSMDRIFDAVKPGSSIIADQVVLLPIEQIAEENLDAERRATMKMADVEIMNEWLQTKMATYPTSTRPTLAIPNSFNQVVNFHEAEAKDGLHYSDQILKIQSTILLNLRCNDVMPKKFPFDKTCCSQYPFPNWVQIVLLTIGLTWGPAGLYFRSQSSTSPTILALFPSQQYLLPLTTFTLSLTFLFAADRTSLLLKETKEYSPLIFAILCAISLAAGVLTLKPAEKDLGFLNRDQTDEWKGWMQIVILIYHYLGASKISGIYNPVRVLVAAYLFMSGYGHLSFFLKKGDYGFKRVMNILVRLNLLVVALAYLMDTDYLSYYFSPLVTIWFLIIWITMFAFHKYNNSTIFLISKLVFAAGVTGIYFTLDGPLEFTFSILNQVFATTWNAKEWRFRVALDLWIVWGGMGVALAFIKIQEKKITEHPSWSKWERWAIIASAITMVGFFGFELTRANKFIYNVYHPYISILPVLAFVILRNSTVYLRSTSSTFFIYFGQCSLETFILQFYIYLSADTRGIIMMIPGGPLLRPLNFIVTSLVFVFLSNQVAVATGSLTTLICLVPTVAKLPTSTQTEYVPLTSISDDKDEPIIVREADKTILSKALDWTKTDLRFRFLLIIIGLWGLNLIYPK